MLALHLSIISTISDTCNCFVFFLSVAYDELPYLGSLYLLAENLVEDLVELTRLGNERQE